MNTLRERLKFKRLELGLTQSALAERVSLKQQSIQLIEAGKTLQPRCILGLARALKCDPNWLIFGDESNQQTKD
ncbi:helix-turn-helix domain-containing protein [Kosakonia oryziphila]|uniref:Helix-turn-helix n=1 Tax=Kosakonia oryziphila TaxID=1005667 RepID=A0A1C4G2M9_9ENTR|nr:helix-turn-helix domain-containing protein [Kosakonia oryziphila]SCC62135.1 Helix-turn-helix [Kosakonia oryziphila]